jgi:hypothetical protein
MGKNKKKKYGKNPHFEAFQNAKIGKPLMKFPLQNDLKPIFAAYLNMARQNMYDTLCHISRMADIPINADEEELSELEVIKILDPTRKKNRKVEVCDYVMRQLLSQFPMLKVMAEEERVTRLSEKANTLELTITADKVFNMMRCIGKVISFQRNIHTHYLLQGDKNDVGGKDRDKYVAAERQMGQYLHTAFTAATRATKERFSTVDNKVDLSIVTKERYVQKERAGNSKIKMEENYDYFYAMRTKDGMLTPIGLVFLICMLITKHQASMFEAALGGNFYGKLNRTEENKNNVELEQARRLIREIFSFYRIRLSKDRIHSERSEYALALDMLNEVNKCPAELFDHLSAVNQNKFRIVTEKTLGDKNNESGEALLLRREDRFPYFALRYIDDMKLFYGMRFHVNYGKYRYVFKPDKECADGEVQPRFLQYELNGFGRLNEIEMCRLSVNNDYKWDGTALIREAKVLEPEKNNELLAYEKDIANMKPYVTDCRTHYLLNSNHVDIHFDLVENGNIENRMLRYMPSIKKYDVKKANEPTKDEASDKTNEYIKRVSLQAICRLSIYELPAMIFHRMLYAHDSVDNGEKVPKISKTEDLIRECVRNYRNLFTDIKNGLIVPGKCTLKQIEEKYGIQEKDIPEKILDLINGKQQGKNKLTEDYLQDKYGISMSDIPDGVRKYSSVASLTPFQEFAIVRIAKMLKQTKNRIKKFEDTYEAVVESGHSAKLKNSIGKKSFKEFNAGSLANFLSKDIVSLMPTMDNGKDRPTGLNYRKMQASIAQFGGALGPTQKELVTLFDNLGLIGNSPIHHPFLDYVLRSKPYDTVSFYKIYLRRREEYLNGILIRSIPNLPFLHANQSRWEKRDCEYYKRLGAKYLAKTIDLPTGLFDKSIKARLSEMSAQYPELKSLLEEKERKCNVSYLIARYHSIVNQDSLQEMYSYERNYRIFDLLNQNCIKLKPNGEPIFKATSTIDFKQVRSGIEVHVKQLKMERESRNKWDRAKTVETIPATQEKKEAEKSKCRRCYNEFNDNERTLRRYQVQDILSFMMAKDILTNHEKDVDEAAKAEEKAERGNINGLRNNFGGFKLKDMSPNNSRSILEQSVPFEMTLTFKNGSRITITQEELKMKNYGDFFMVLSDSRIESLLPYIQDVAIKKVSREILEAELDMYDRERVGVFENMQNIEKGILEVKPELRDKKFEDGKPITNNFNALLSEFGVNGENGEIHNILVDIRNAFCHNHYTDKDCVRLSNAQLGKIAEQITQVVKEQKGKLPLSK